MKRRTAKQLAYILIVLGAILLVSHLNYKEIQDDKQAQIDCKIQDTETNY